MRIIKYPFVYSVSWCTPVKIALVLAFMLLSAPLLYAQQRINAGFGVMLGQGDHQAKGSGLNLSSSGIIYGVDYQLPFRPNWAFVPYLLKGREDTGGQEEANITLYGMEVRRWMKRWQRAYVGGTLGQARLQYDNSLSAALPDADEGSGSSYGITTGYNFVRFPKAFVHFRYDLSDIKDLGGLTDEGTVDVDWSGWMLLGGYRW